jgi:hypothetical protein
MSKNSAVLTIKVPESAIAVLEALGEMEGTNRHQVSQRMVNLFVRSESAKLQKSKTPAAVSASGV